MRTVGLPSRVVIAGFLSCSLLPTGCLSLGGPGQTHVPGTESQPGPGSALIFGNPAHARDPLTIEFVGVEGSVIEGRTARIPSGGVIEASVTNLPGRMGVRVNGAPCDGTFGIEADMLTHVALRFVGDTCIVGTERIEPL